MERVANIGFGLGFGLFNLGLILSYYFAPGYDLILVGAAVSIIALLVLLIYSNYKNLNDTLTYLLVIFLILSLTFFLFDYPYSKQMRLGFLIIATIYFIKRGFSENLLTPLTLSSNSFFNHPLLRIVQGLVILYCLFKIMHWDFTEYILQAISITLILWSYFKFIRVKRVTS